MYYIFHIAHSLNYSATIEIKHRIYPNLQVADNQGKIFGLGLDPNVYLLVYIYMYYRD